MSALISPSAVARSAWQPESVLRIGGITPFTATDYPGKLAAVVFVQGCPWRCGYCHNPHLQTRTGLDGMAWRQVVARLQRRVGLIDAVVFSGGEPTIDPGLVDAMREVRAMGFGVGLHTAGAYPRRLAEVLPLVDWVGMDIKAGFDTYDTITRIVGSARHALASAEQVLASGVAHEFRTTVHPSLHTQADILALAQSLSAMGVRRYALQRFRATGCADAGLTGVTSAAFIGPELLTRVAALFETFSYRCD
ncbi:anaerobic ribonucleoside-triphosphate reductase activating protein [Rhodoferax sp.]|uniref:anaerobic ribonucleoside-triphosphate reductase activating protein n=1 Tax=Rhodoferax sp. TaxID=50421 RepID=UPI00275A2E0E|nr:anaerobic ribonucleoside-triphosphate reductase activating protein [Rhodoferax sp.]